jgi:hypothetical protein
MAAKASHPEQLLALLREREPSIIQAGLDEVGEPYLYLEPLELSDAQRDTLATLMLNAASGLLGGSLGGVVH